MNSDLLKSKDPEEDLVSAASRVELHEASPQRNKILRIPTDVKTITGRET